ncbi:N-acetyl-1-D-myo-inositol-2-amino-2-deoxy-alpha-D-glucopyranoside deacetylase [Nocardioides bruguierae]|uniref:1D-myo-inositol 2-acetamido-2-deoxy-alpha-D-glucopyranoside deacetylase n=1 Tax=Nocardioides bruguierae TaxID=2945102 RepID=A0A9X2D7H1_9ACTN|nr:N-acetyl-1-D-myo-inositol-2-amino-2-deoxy-alpha-D-glucopyranoside deacetylase [Nocardioides bruguierae]MCL8025718.1 N-acetyl-1-D-myo-inositol-2-amino-2-deoxy-alpha-D-glucopyranoside deacetylase [Nocardioides bruguierae]MCM0620570.1 N-acetyl-1-D-myo-inositol-2-amino-2-deoxy-alpha-D-glucopyranoside deacetylase [Nocardioides bruguierae]
MTSSPLPVADQRLLLVHAHPDDETIGNGATMAKYVAEGRRVTMVTCTAGEMGEILVPELEHLAADREDKLGEHRRGEIADAMAALGVTDHRFLGGFGRFRDSGMKWAPEGGYAIPADDVHENAFWHSDLVVAADELVRIIREVRPQVLVTYDEFGGYGHPDHKQAHRVATYGAALAAVPSYKPELGAAWDIPKHYWNAMSESRMREGMRQLKAAGEEVEFFGGDPDGPLPPVVVADEHLAAVVDGGSEGARAKLDAMRAYPTQIQVDGPFFALSNNLGDRVWAEEFYRLAKGVQGPVNDEGLETDLFAGLDSSWA